MSNTLRILLVSSSIIGLLAITALQQKSIGSYKNFITIQDSKIKIMDDIIKEQDKEIEHLTAENTNLQMELDIVRDSINILNNDLVILKQSALKATKSLAAVQKELDIRQKELDFLKSELKKSQKSKNNEAKLKARIADLEGQVRQIQFMKEQTESEADEVTDEVEEVEAYIQDKEEVASTMSRLALIMNQTHVDIKSVSLRETRDGDSIRKLKNDGKNWKYTVINFDLFNENNRLLTDANFEWRIVDMDTGEPISFLESNYVYPAAPDEKGLTFTYPGYAQELVFINTEKKEGSNYELRLYYLEDDQAYYVNGSSKPIIFDQRSID